MILPYEQHTCTQRNLVVRSCNRYTLFEKAFIYSTFRPFTSTMAIQVLLMFVFIGLISCGAWHKRIQEIQHDATDGKLKPPQARLLNTIKTSHRDIQAAQVQPNIAVYDNNVCSLQLKQKSISYFRHVAYYGDLGFVFLRLNFTDGLVLQASDDIVGENVWIWTYYGQKGGLEFLSWPMEFGVWSMGILSTFVGGPLDMELYNISGNCSNLEVGNKDTDLAISAAFINLTEEMISVDGDDRRYGSSFWCYKRRMYINPHAVYNLCKHILCPVEALEYVCRSYFYNPKVQHRELSNREFIFNYDTLWWVGPFIVAVVLFSYSPLLLLSLAAGANIWLNKVETVHKKESDEYIFLDGTNHVTLANTLLGPLFSICKKKNFVSTRIIRAVLPWFSLCIVGLQILLDYRYLHDVVLVSIDKGVPMGFRSMLAGYNKSSLNFLPYLGGPFVACSVYLLVTSLLIVIPKSLPNILESGLTDKDTVDGISPVSLSTSVLERYGSVLITKHHGYERVCNVLLAQFYLLLNLKFWKLVFQLQKNRGTKLVSITGGPVILPIYIIICAMEVVLCILLYGLPFVSFAIIIFRAYSGLLYRSLRRFVWPVFIWFLFTLLVVSILFFMFMFCTIFLDACLFVSRLCIFTYIGVVVYPRVSYGYMIFVATVIYYLWESIRNFSSYYTGLLRVTVSVCESIQRANDTEPLVLRRSHCKGIGARLFNDVIELYYPRRKKVFTSLLQMSVIFCVLGMSVHLLVQTDKFQELHTIMHVGTTLFICAFPKIFKSMCCSQDSKYKQRRQKAEIKVIVRRCLDFFSDNEDFDDDLINCETENTTQDMLSH